MVKTQAAESDLDVAFFLDFLLRRWWIVAAVWAAIMAATALKTFTTRPVYEASALLVIEKERSSGGVYSNNAAMVENTNDDYYQTQYKLLQSDSLMRRVYETLRLDAIEEFAQPHGPGKLRAATIVSPVRGSRLLYVRARSWDAQLASKMANTLGETFVAENLGNQMFISKEVLEALQVRQGDPEARRLYEGLPQVVNSPLIQGLKVDYAKQESQAAALSQRFTDRHPEMMSLKSSMATLKTQIQAETERIVQSLKAELSGQLRGNNVRIIDAAQVPDRPVLPNTRKNLLLGLIAGLLAGVLVAYLAELLDQSVRTQADVENRLRLPYLGALPFSPQRPGEAVYGSLMAPESSLTSESFRNLRTMVDFAGVSVKSNVLMVTSAVQDEGKTYVSTSLAVAISQLGERVLLVSGDLRRPKLQNAFELSTERGLSDFLAAGTRTEEIEELLQDTDVPNLKVLVCGPRPPNPSELLNTPRLGAFLAWAKASFDRVIIDCTPLFPINDTLLWARHVPAAVFVVRYGRTRAPLIQSACQKLQAGGVKILGIALNATQTGGLGYSPYGYYYQHQYYQEYREGEKSAA